METGWLIETANQTWWDGKSSEKPYFTHDPSDAIRFARFEDAERAKYWLLRSQMDLVRSTEHAWIDGVLSKE